MALLPSFLRNHKKDTRTVGGSSQSIFLIVFTIAALVGIEARLAFLQIVGGRKLPTNAPKLTGCGWLANIQKEVIFLTAMASYSPVPAIPVLFTFGRWPIPSPHGQLSLVFPSSPSFSPSPVPNTQSPLMVSVKNNLFSLTALKCYYSEYLHGNVGQ